MYHEDKLLLPVRRISVFTGDNVDNQFYWGHLRFDIKETTSDELMLIRFKLSFNGQSFFDKVSLLV